MNTIQIPFALLLTFALAIFTWLAWSRLTLLSIGRAENRFDRPLKRLKAVLLDAIGQRRVISRPFGFNHLVIFWSFLLLGLANGEFIVQGLFPGFSLGEFLPSQMHHALLACFDVVSLLVLLAVATATFRRTLIRPSCLEGDYVSGRSSDAFLILGAIAVLMLAYLGLHASEIALGRESSAGWMPVSNALAGLLSTLPRTSFLEPLASICWWLHALVLLAFLCYLPASKHMHVLTAIPNCFFRTLGRANTQKKGEFTPGASYGVAAVNDFSWKDLLDSFACTECGRCQEACPARVTGKSLNPRQVIHAIKCNLMANADSLRLGGRPELPLVGDPAEATLDEKAIWGCTTCGACMAACPVCIEQMPKIVELRRHLVQMKSSFPEELLGFFENVENRANPWGIAPGERTKWAANMEARPYLQGETEYLFYVGCAGAFDSRNKQVTSAVARILDAAGVSWGVLGREEKCCGDSVRRLGNEYLFDQLARENVALLRERGVRKIVTHCPHCFSVLKNDYRQFGLEVEVIHHSELIRDLIAQGRLQPENIGDRTGATFFHDSCYLGRHNDVYEAPRQVLAAATGSVPMEMARNLQNSFCCGAGGGRMWLEEHEGERINRERVTEALSSKPDTICVSCPYCLTMFEDGLKDKEATDVKVYDIAEVVALGIRSAVQ